MANTDFAQVLREVLAMYHSDWRTDPPGVSVHTLEKWRQGGSVQESAFYRFLTRSEIPRHEQERLKRLYLETRLTIGQPSGGTSDTNQSPNISVVGVARADPMSITVDPIPENTLLSGQPVSRQSRLFFLLAVLAVSAFVVILLTGQLTLSEDTVNTTNRTWIPEEVSHKGMTMVRVPAGCVTIGFQHGRENEAPVHQVCVDEFWMGKTEVTNAQFGSHAPDSCNLNQIDGETLVNSTDPAYPRNCVTWEEANTFCEEYELRLPTEVEWEYAVRGPDGWLYPWGNDASATNAIVRISNDPASPRPMQPTGSMPLDKTWVGALDMAGSLREFTSTVYAADPETVFTYPYVADDGRESLENHGEPDNEGRTTRVVRGGNFDLPIDQARATYRYDEWYNFRFNTYGFRCVGDLS